MDENILGKSIDLIKKQNFLNILIYSGKFDIYSDYLDGIWYTVSEETELQKNMHECFKQEKKRIIEELKQLGIEV